MSESRRLSGADWLTDGHQCQTREVSPSDLAAPPSISSGQESSSDNCHPNLAPTRTARENRESRGDSVTALIISGAQTAVDSQSLTSPSESSLITSVCKYSTHTWTPTDRQHWFLSRLLGQNRLKIQVYVSRNYFGLIFNMFKGFGSTFFLTCHSTGLWTNTIIYKNNIYIFK